MTKTEIQLQSVVEQIETKATEYEEFENYEAKKQQYLSSLSSVESSLGRLEVRIESLEFHVRLLTTVHDRELSVSGEVDLARERARSLLQRDENDFYELAVENNEDDYDQKIQQAISRVNKAKDAVKDELRDVQSEWGDRVETARSVQKLVGESREMSETLREIEKFVSRTMWEESKDINQLAAKWKNLETKYHEGEVGWETFQQNHDLSDETVVVLQRLANEGEITLDKLDDAVASEMLSIDALRNVVKISI
ncbi:hypothetical protein [Haloarcula marismortui]|jgi:hypothetical protein|uniref:Uncharacterized protein n=1 Tax=Haloarcula marismortui ATCC 33800 TaxID=662476 RepID=M0JPW2_9EURY|nr:hypothetical protein [Haloarcula sinaiiensis]EMA09994.1 hypothetical protein C436_18286 [Haloarcula sinaiiensis ATCC 33800]QUJ74978.1 hypothetical protein KDQ40_22280 [Haloarcula sinaiiensis ATCC 33800]